MNYLNHYNNLINRAKNRKLDIYTESHHILPKCIGGTDDKSNLVDLTPEEHFVAHQLLVKIYPNNRELIHAAIMMTVEGKNHNRSMNKLYGWLRRKLSEAMSNNQTGEKNSQYGTIWIYNDKLNISKKIKVDELSFYINNDWVKGRNLKKKVCESCDKEFLTRKVSAKSCSKECEHQIRSQSAQEHPLCRGVVDDNNNKFKSLSSASRYHSVNIETIRYRIKIGRYGWVN